MIFDTWGDSCSKTARFGVQWGFLKIKSVTELNVGIFGGQVFVRKCYFPEESSDFEVWLFRQMRDFQERWYFREEKGVIFVRKVVERKRIWGEWRIF